MSKGSKPRPVAVSSDELAERWAMIDWSDDGRSGKYRKKLAELVIFEDEKPRELEATLDRVLEWGRSLPRNPNTQRRELDHE